MVNSLSVIAKMLLVDSCLNCEIRSDDHSNDRGESWCTASEEQGNIEDVTTIPAWCKLRDAPEWVAVSEPVDPPWARRIVVLINGAELDVAYVQSRVGNLTTWGEVGILPCIKRHVTHWLRGMPPVPQEASDGNE